MIISVISVLFLFFTYSNIFFYEKTMKAIIQNYRSGELAVTELPPPKLRPGGILVHNAASLVSAGTERLMVELAQKNLLGKARERPDLVQQVLEKARRDGIVTTIEAVRRRLDTPTPLGYSCAGTVIGVGEGVEYFQLGDRVACAGAGYASHAEVIFVPKNLAVQLPDGVDFESAAFTTLGAIALQGLRLAEIELGDIVVVIGLGLVGLLTVQLAKAAGCLVLGMDIQANRAELAHKIGANAVATDAETLQALVQRLSSAHGADAVLITAATKSNDPIALAGQVARDRATVVAVGAVGMDVPRKIYFKKELTLRVSRSYGPGRYDTDYEEKGRDYPIAYVRWTENRNMQAFVQQVAEGKVTVKALITHRFAIAQASKAYDLITNQTGESFLGILLSYPEEPNLSAKVLLKEASSQSHAAISPAQSVKVGLIGAGSFATGTLLPAMQKVNGIELVGVCTATGVSAQHVAQKFGFHYATTDEKQILDDPEVNTVVIATRHHLHARQVIAALKAGKHVFCEKPLALNEEELREIVETYQKSPANRLMVGFNRRFAPMARKLRNFLAQVEEPLVMHYRVNAGYIPPDHWVHDPTEGGGRIIGEVCHFIDFLTFLAGSLPTQVYARALPNNDRYRDDNLVITLDFANGSLGTITYVANGDKAFPKERVEVFAGGSVAVLDNFRKLELLRDGRRKVLHSRLRQDKGHRGEWEAFVEALRSGSTSITLDEVVATSLITFRILESLHKEEPANISV
jgi:predicted dehydrogenase/threonine dehydrogenase-like Zn-dependent dehydrogenase